MHLFLNNNKILNKEYVSSTNIVFVELRAFKLLFLKKHINVFTKSVCIKNDSPLTVVISGLSVKLLSFL